LRVWLASVRASGDLVPGQRNTRNRAD